MRRKRTKTDIFWDVVFILACLSSMLYSVGHPLP